MNLAPAHLRDALSRRVARAMHAVGLLAYDVAFTRAMPLLLVHEGGYVNNPADPGGATNFGITQSTFDAWNRVHGRPLRAVRGITHDEVLAIYASEYWTRGQCGMLHAGVSYAVFDADVNSGVGAGSRWLQRACGVTADGIVGVHTIAAAQAMDPAALVNGICDERLAFLHSLSTWADFGGGWRSRVADVRRVGLVWAAEGSGVPVTVTHVPGTARRAYLPVA